MRSPSPQATQLWECLGDALRHGRTVGSVELKVLLDATVEEAMAALGTIIRRPLLRTVYYLDTPELDLQRRNVIVRARITTSTGEGRSIGDVVVKLCRPGRRSNRLPVELDVLPDEVRWSAAARRRLSSTFVDRAVRKRLPARRLLSAGQRELMVAACATRIDDLVLLGPAEVVRLSSAVPENRIAVETWRLPSGRRITELSTKCRPGDARAAVRALRNLIGERRLTVSDLQMTKTRIALLDCSRRACPADRVPHVAAG